MSEITILPADDDYPPGYDEEKCECCYTWYRADHIDILSGLARDFYYSMESDTFTDNDDVLKAVKEVLNAATTCVNNPPDNECDYCKEFWAAQNE